MKRIKKSSYVVPFENLRAYPTPFGQFLKVNRLNLEVTRTNTEDYCADCGIHFRDTGITGPIIGFGSTPKKAIHAMIGEIMERAGHGSHIFYYGRNRSFDMQIEFRASVPDKMILDWQNFQKFFKG